MVFTYGREVSIHGKEESQRRNSISDRTDPALGYVGINGNVIWGYTISDVQRSPS